ncbi:MAG: polymerase III subunit gamma/tau protein [Parcubacteria group bacterium GW2011_GWA2_42_18]|nr:MAG: polymerase III subunit gamma/tau protein [Parcubacteria group bacterium GW2011_GWA2_42_18]
MVLYRKYRPQKFEDVLGQDHIIKVLCSALKSGRVSHAYLFSGSRGIGKTSVARIMARDLGSTENDVYEIDAASNRGIDEIRALREAVRTLPLESKYKVYIIDEVHMLTKEAFNALLKTLEEPPAHTIFILATTELEKVPDTIVSRCQTFVFRKPSDKLLKDSILNIARSEKLQISEAGAELIALLSEGSFRDAQGILQKVASYSENRELDISEIEEVTGAPKSSLVNSFIKVLCGGQLEKGFEIINQISRENFDMKIFLKLVVHKFRMALILRYAPEMKGETAHLVSESDLEFLKKLAKEHSSAVRSQTLEVLLEAYQAGKNALIPELPLELALIKILGQDEK